MLQVHAQEPSYHMVTRDAFEDKQFRVVRSEKGVFCCYLQLKLFFKGHNRREVGRFRCISMDRITVM